MLEEAENDTDIPLSGNCGEGTEGSECDIRK